jgi:hypothetical protein
MIEFMISIPVIKGKKKTNGPKVIMNKSFKTWCDKYYTLVIKDMCEVINDSLVIV